MSEQNKSLEKPKKTTVYFYASIFLMSFFKLIYDLTMENTDRIHEYVLWLIFSSILLIVSVIIYRKHKLLHEKANDVQRK